MRRLILAALLAVAAAPAGARPVVVELFTSEGCSSCPPAEALLRQLKATDPDILPLSFHVTYWNSPAWTDGYALQAATDRQNQYATLAHSDEVYTPEAVVDGTRQMIGSDRGDVTAAISAARQEAENAVPVRFKDGATVAVDVGAAPAKPRATVWLVGYDPAHTTKIGGGENGGATVAEVNVVRSVTPLGVWSGRTVTYQVARPAGLRLAVLVQQADGVMDGAAD